MKELSSLRKLAEAAKSPRDPVDTFFNKLEGEVDDAFSAIKVIRQTLQSQVLSDMVKQFGMPATESKAAQTAAEEAWAAIKKLEGEFNDLYMAMATAAEPSDE